MTSNKIPNSPTTSQVYDLIDRKIEVVNNTMLRLEGKFDALESGRLSAVEKELNKMQVAQAITNTKIAIYIGIITFVVSVGINLFMGRLM